MRVAFRKVSDRRHVVTVERADGSPDSVELDSKDFLRHDLAHFAVELELRLAGGVWGSVAAGGRLTGDGLDGEDMALAERLAGPVQTLMRTHADAAQLHEVLARVGPEVASPALADVLTERLRSLSGHWAGTPFGSEMVLDWPDDLTPR